MFDKAIRERRESGVWVVWFYDHDPVIASIHNSELAARRAGEGFDYVSFVPFGADVRDALRKENSHA